MKQVIVPIFVPHQGCPEQCVFCNQYKITGNWHTPSLLEIASMVDEWTSSSGVVPDLAFYGGSFTAIVHSTRQKLLETACQLKRHGKIKRIRLSTRPDALEDDVLEELKNYSVDVIEIGIQSLDSEVLEKSLRGHSAKQALDAIERVKKAGFECGAQLMLGLPSDTREKSLDNCRKIIQARPDFVRMYPTVVLRGTQLEKLYLQGEYVPWDFDYMIETATEMVKMFEAGNIPIRRIGLQAEENLQFGADIIAGLHHPALGELVFSRVYRHRMEKMLQSNPDINCFIVSPQYYSQAVGQHKCNCQYLSNIVGHSVYIEKDPLITGKQIECR